MRSGPSASDVARRHGPFLRILAFVAAFGALPVAHAAPPTVSYSPAPDTTLPEGADCAAASGTGGFEIDFAGACTPGVDCIITATSNADGSGNSPTDFTFVGCSIANQSGNGSIDVSTGGGISFVGSESGSREIAVSCSAGTTTTTARVCCLENRGSSTEVQPFWDVRCPSPDNPEFNSSPTNGALLSMTTTLGSPTSVNLQVTNTGTGNLSVVASGLSDDLSVSPDTEVLIAPGPGQTFTIGCDGSTLGTTSQQLELVTNDASEGLVTYPVECTVTAPAAPNIVVTPAPPGPLGIFGVQPSQASANFTISNNGSATLSVTSITGLSAPFSVSPGNATITAGNAQQITVFCSGASPGSFNDTLTINSNDGDEPQVDLDVSCNITAPEFSGTPSPPGPLALAAVQNSMPNPTTTFTVENFGDATLTINPVSEQNPGGPITISPTSTTIPPSGSQVFTVTCATNVAPNAYTDTFTLSTNDADEQNVQYNATCDISSAPAPEFNSTPGSPGPVTITTGAGVQGTAMITVQNAGTATLNITSIVESDPSGVFSFAPAAPVNITAGNSQAFTVNCQSGVANTYTGSLTFSTNDTSEASVPFNLSCTVSAAPTAPEYASSPVTPGPLTINTTQGTNSTTTLTINNTGNANLVISSFSGLSAPISISPTSFTIAPNGTRAFVLTCTAGTPGTFNRTLTVNSNDSDESAVVYNVACNVAPAPPVFGFGSPAQSVTPGTANAFTLSGIVATDSTPEATITVRNTALAGGAAMSVNALRPPSPFYTELITNSVAAGGAGAPNVSVFRIGCSPRVVGTVGTTVLVDTNATNVDPARYPVSCQGAAGPEYNSVPSSTITINTTRPTPTYSGLPIIILPATATLTIENDGVQPLRIFGATLVADSLSVVAPSSYPVEIAAGSTAAFSVRCSRLAAAGIFKGTLTIESNDVSEQFVKYSVTCTVAPPPASLRTVSTLMSTDFFDDVRFRDGFE